MSKWMLAPLASAALTLAAPQRSAAQLPGGGLQDEIVIEAIRTEFDGEGVAKFPTSTWFISGVWQATPAAALVTEIPLSYARFESPFNGGAETDFAIGNPYVGVYAPIADDGPAIEFGVYLPVARDEDLSALLRGLYADLTRFYAFLPEWLAVSSTIGYRHIGPSGFGVRLRAGPSLLHPTGDGGDDELFAAYSNEVLYEGDAVRVGLQLSGLVQLTDDGNFDERSDHQLTARMDVDVGGVRPGIRFVLPTGHYRSVVDYGVGVVLAIPLR